ncbi:MAG: T9SS type A sorting domain-containing protein [Saprospiraceae bacterium]
MKHLIFTLLLGLLTMGVGSAQTCSVDSNILNYPGALLSPATYSPDSPFYNLNVACIGQPYSQSITFNIPPTYLNLPLDSVSIPQTGGVMNLPAGLTYNCNPPTCRFPKSSLGCVLIYGTPTPANTSPDTLDLTITATIYSIFPLTVDLPGDLAANDHYYLILDCAQLAAFELGRGSIGTLKVSPNPSSGLVAFTMDVLESDRYQLQVFDVFGRLQVQESHDLVAGENTTSLDLSSFSSGQYQVVLLNAKGGVTQRLVVQH